MLSSLLHTNPPRQAPVHNESAARATTTALMAGHVAVASLRGEVAAAEHAAGEQPARYYAFGAVGRLLSLPPPELSPPEKRGCEREIARDHRR